MIIASMKITLSGERMRTEPGGTVTLELLNGMNGRIERNLDNVRDEWSKRGLM